jgi:hypothetical protein
MCGVAQWLQILGLIFVGVGVIATALDFTSASEVTDAIRAWWDRTRANAMRWVRRVLLRRVQVDAGSADAVGMANDARVRVTYGTLDASNIPGAIAILDARVREVRDSLTALQEKVAHEGAATRATHRSLADQLAAQVGDLAARDVAIARGSIGWFILGFALSVAGLIFAGSC